MSSSIQKVHYASYDKKKSKGKKKAPIASSSTNSTSSISVQKPNSTGKLCFRCKAPFTKEHIAMCKAQNAVCDECGIKGHYKKA